MSSNAKMAPEKGKKAEQVVRVKRTHRSNWRTTQAAQATALETALNKLTEEGQEVYQIFQSGDKYTIVSFRTVASIHEIPLSKASGEERANALLDEEEGEDGSKA